MTAEMIRAAVRDLHLAGQPLCVHASLRSFGNVEGGAATIVDALLADGCTVMVPTFSTSAFEVWPSPRDLIPQNAWGPEAPSGPTPGATRVYTSDSPEIDDDMGAIAAALLARPGRVRGRHPLNSFSAVGPRAHELIDRQTPSRVYGPLDALIEARGLVVLMGVGFNRLTLLHAAEQRAGRALFIRWALDADGRIIRVRVGGCSEGFRRLASVLAPLTTERTVGRSRWLVLPAAAAFDAAARAIQREPTVTHCDDPVCARCEDAIRGGPTTPEQLGAVT